jgi:hypothetical protein
VDSTGDTSANDTSDEVAEDGGGDGAEDPAADQGGEVAEDVVEEPEPSVVFELLPAGMAAGLGHVEVLDETATCVIPAVPYCQTWSAPVGAQVRITAPDNEDALFVSWEGVDCEIRECTFVPTNGQQVLARFRHNHNYVFATETQRSAVTLGSVANADTICNNEAAGNDWEGDYVAFLSTVTQDARTRLSGYRGWLVVYSQQPFLDLVGALESGRTLAHFGGGGVNVLTASTGQGAYDAVNGSCSDYTSEVGSINVGNGGWTGGRAFNYNTIPCTAEARLLCFERRVDRALELPPVTDRVAFVTEGTFTPTAAGRDAADDLCQAEADAAELEGDFLAVLSTEDEGPFDRFETTPAWVRPDGVRVLNGNPSRVCSQNIGFEAPVNLNASGTTYYVGDEEYWWGASTSCAALLNESCSDWTSTEGTTRSAWAANYNPGIDDAACNVPRHLLCFEN